MEIFFENFGESKVFKIFKVGINYKILFIKKYLCLKYIDLNILTLMNFIFMYS